jgi:hypothetical protein
MKPLIAILCASLLFSAELMAQPTKLPKPTSAEKNKIAKLVRRMGEIARRDASKRKSGGGGFGMTWEAGDSELTEITEALIKYGAKVDFAVPELAGYLASASDQSVLASVEVLVSTARGDSVNALNALAKSLGTVKPEESLVAILGGLGELEAKAESAVPAILERLAGDNQVRRASLKALARIGVSKTEGAEAKILALIDDPERAIGLAACAALIKLGKSNEKVLKFLIDFADNSKGFDPDRQIAVENLGNLGEGAAPAVEALRKIALNQPAKVLLFPGNIAHKMHLTNLRVAAIESLGKIGGPARSTIPDLETLVADPDFATAAKAALARIRASAP